MPPPLDRLHQQAQQALKLRVGQLSAGVVKAINGHDRSAETYNLYAKAQTELIGAGQQRSATLAMAYMAEVNPPDTAPSLTHALDGVLVEEDSPRVTAGIERLWGLIDEGVEEAEAVDNASAYASLLGEGAVTSAERGGLEEGSKVGENEPVGWRKEPSPNACDWCQTIADGGGRYSEADSVPRHDNCMCSVAPVFADEAEPGEEGEE